MSIKYERSDFSMATLISGNNKFEKCAVILNFPNHLDIRFNSLEDKDRFKKEFCKKEMSKELKVIRHGFSDLLLTYWIASCNEDVPPKLVAVVTFTYAFSVQRLQEDTYQTKFKEIYIEYPFFYYNHFFRSLINGSEFVFFENSLIKISFYEEKKEFKSYTGKNSQRETVKRYFHITNKKNDVEFLIKDIFIILKKINYFFTVIFQDLPIEPESVYFSYNALDSLLLERKYSNDTHVSFVFQSYIKESILRLFHNFYKEYDRLEYSCYALDICNFSNWSKEARSTELIFLFNGCAHALDDITNQTSKKNSNTQLMNKLKIIRDENNLDKEVYKVLDELIEFKRNQKDNYRNRLKSLIKSFALHDFKDVLSADDKEYLKQKKPEFSIFLDRNSSSMFLYDLFMKEPCLLNKMENKTIKNIVSEIVDCRNNLSHGRDIKNINKLIEAFINVKVILRLAIIDIIDNESLINKTHLWLKSREELSRYYKNIEE
ncbi:hypothetical protein ACFPDQ_00740 [Pseudofrancisella aestuarii]|uniref:Apea-like HEPN domain-containing protein n=1 Tax=Pseudofrancisella aestuarii TaxID=2670347 RepID=A0ABV9T9Z5_9GAMM|nr:hypothetical protein [Pseudofrancisella aestuarii]